MPIAAAEKHATPMEFAMNLPSPALRILIAHLEKYAILGQEFVPMTTPNVEPWLLTKTTRMIFVLKASTAWDIQTGVLRLAHLIKIAGTIPTPNASSDQLRADVSQNTV